MISLTVQSLLLADPDVQQLVGQAVTPNKMDDRLPARAIVVTLISLQETQTLTDGPADVRRARVQVDAWAKSMVDAAALGKAAYAVLSPLRRMPCSDGSYICGVARDSAGSSYDPEAKMHRVTADYLIDFYE